MFIETDRLVIRDLETSDGAIFADMASDGSLVPVGLDSAFREWVDEWLTDAQQLAKNDDPAVEYLAYTIELKGTQQVVGSVGCSYYKDLEKIGICYFIGTEYRKHGYAAEAVKAYVPYFLQRYQQDEIIATVLESNVPSWKTVEKAGFTLTEKKQYQDFDDASEQPYRFYRYTL